MACYRIIVIYRLRLFIDLEQCEVVGVDIERADIHLWGFAFASVVVDLLSPATEGVRDRCDLTVCIPLLWQPCRLL